MLDWLNKWFARKYTEEVVSQLLAKLAADAGARGDYNILIYDNKGKRVLYDITLSYSFKAPQATRLDIVPVRTLEKKS